MGALCFPDYVDSGLEKFSLVGQSISFMPPRREMFPLLDAAYSAVRNGPLYTIAFNAADEVAANAFIEGREYVVPEDVKSVAHDVLRHRLVLSYEAAAEQVTSDRIIDQILAGVAVP